MVLSKVKSAFNQFRNYGRQSSYPFYRKFRSPLELRHLDTRICVEREYKFVYFRIPKAANSTVVNTIYSGIYPDQKLKTEELEKWKVDGFCHPSTLTSKDVQAVLANYFKFTFCRHPVTRLLSAYRDKIERDELKLFGPRIRKKLGLPVNEIVSLDHFLYYLEKLDGVLDNAHWARQVDLIPLPIASLDFVGRIENLQQDLPKVSLKLFGKQLAIKNHRPHRTNATEAANMLDRKTLLRIFEIYRQDFDTFGYELTEEDSPK